MCCVFTLYTPEYRRVEPCRVSCVCVPLLVQGVQACKAYGFAELDRGSRFARAPAAAPEMATKMRSTQKRALISLSGCLYQVYINNKKSLITNRRVLMHVLYIESACACNKYTPVHN